MDRLGRASSEQASDLFIDFAPALAIFSCIPAAVIAVDSAIVFWSLCGLFTVIELIALRWRVRRVSVEVEHGKIRIRNTFRNWAIDPSDVTA